MQRAEWDEQSELRELNARLWLYVSRVRDLEEENRRLAQELAALRGRDTEQRACRLREREEEVAELRLAVAELSRARGEAELERDALRQELARLESWGAQSVELRRRRLEPELAALRRQLESLRADCAALEALLERLRAEHGRLQEERRRRPRPAELPLPLALPAGPRSAVSRRELEETCALVLSWNCEQSLERYEAELRALQELEGRLGREDAQQLRAQNQQSLRQLQELHRRWLQLGALAERLEAERGAQQERQGAERAEYQMIIEALEEEKQFLTTSIAEYLKDYHELLQVKAGLSLEIATYRALLEGESSQWILMWDEEHGRKLPQGVRNMLYEYSNRHSAYRPKKGERTFPAIQNVDTRYKSPRTNISSSAVYSRQTKTEKTQAAAPGKILRRDAFKSAYHPSATVKRDVTRLEQREIGTFTPPYLLSRASEAQRTMPPERKRTEAGSTVSFSKESTGVHKYTTSPNISENVKTRVSIPTFPSPSLSSSSKETKYEKTVDGTRIGVNDQIKDAKPVKDEKTVLFERSEKKEVLAKERTASDSERFREKPAGIERNANFEQKTEIKQDGEKQTLEEFTIKHNKTKDRFMADRPSKYILGQEQMGKDASEKNVPADIKMEESYSFQKERNASIVTQSKETVEIPIHFEAHTHDQMLKTSNTEHRPSSEGGQKGEATFKLTREPNQKGEDEGSRVDSLLTESIAANIVSDILKGFVQKPSGVEPPPASEATSFEKKEVLEDGKLKTEINIQATLQDDLNVSDDFDLVSILKKDAKKVLEDSEGNPSERVVEDIVNARVKGMEGKSKRSVHVEIVEEPLGSSAEERVEASTPFEVEEAEDMFPSMTEHSYYSDEERHVVRADRDLKEKQPSVIVTHVEEVPEGDDVVDEEKYFVSTPDEHPWGHMEDESSIYGQIHIEEESTVKYSWQDEFLQGSQTKIGENTGSPELVYQVMGGEASAFSSKEETPKEQVAHAESIVIEKEIKIPHEFQESIKTLFSQESKDPKHQLKEALEKLDDTLPESIKQELSVLTKESQADSSSLEVDIKKVEHTKKGGLVTIVAEVNLSQTLESDQFSPELLGEGVADKIRLPPQSPSEGNFDEYKKEKLESSDVDRNKVGIDVSSVPWTVEEVSSSAKLSSHDDMQYFSNEQVVHRGPVFKSMETDSKEEVYPSQRSLDIDRRVRQIVVGPTEIHRTEEVLYEGPVSENLQFGSGDLGAEASANVSQSIREFRHGPEEIQSTERIIYRGPAHKTVEVSDSEGPAEAQISTDIWSSNRITLGSKQIIEETVFEGPASDLSSSQSSETLLQVKGPAESSRTIRHIRIEPKEVRTEHVVYEGVLPGLTELSTSGDRIQVDESVRRIRIGQDTQFSNQTGYEESLHKAFEPGHAPDNREGMLNTSTTVRHITLSPKEFAAEQIVFTGPISEQHLRFSEQGQFFSSEGLVKHIQLGQKSGEHVVHQGSESSGVSSSGEDISEEGGPTEISRSTRRIQLSSVEAPVEQMIFHGPVSETLRFGTAERSPTDGPAESSRSAGHIKIGPKEASFTFQMDVTSMAGGGPEATIVVPSKKGAEAHQLESTGKDDQKGAENEPRSEDLTFDRTVQLQRMVDQRSVISDEKKIALLYLNEKEGEEEEEEEDGPWF